MTISTAALSDRFLGNFPSGNVERNELRSACLAIEPLAAGN